LSGQHTAHRPCDAAAQNGEARDHRQVLRVIVYEQQAHPAKPDDDCREQPHLEPLSAKYEEFQNDRGDGQCRLDD
jgi:hypothetical protein